ncbi:MAG: type VI secretion system lipoprotein TssJ [Desulfosalsimonadaceae bacterium]
MNLKKNARTFLKNTVARSGRDGRYLLVVLSVFVISACASSLPPPDWTFQREAIDLHIKADPRLNLKGGAPHTLLVCVYQLENPIPFDRLAADTAGLYKLLECELFDASVATSTRLFVHPGEDQHRVLDRAQGARHVAVVAGYYTIEKERIVNMYDIPVTVERSGFLWRNKKQKPQHVDIQITLGPQQILSVKGN